MRKKNKLLLLIPTFCLLLVGCGTTNSAQANLQKNSSASFEKTVASTNAKTQTKGTNETHKYPAEAIPPGTPVGPNFDWTKPSDGPYPTIQPNETLWIDASLTDQRIHIMDGNKTIYTMITSSGLDGPDTQTPTGTYYVEPERGTWFYSPQYQEGAEYWVSWKGHGEFLFHSVPMDSNKQVIPDQVAKLGVKSSHGCFHLTLADAKWIYDNIQTGTKVVIHN